MEKQIIPLEQLLPAASFCRGFTSVRGIIPINQHLVFEEDRMLTFNGDSGVIWFLPWTAAAPFTVPADSFVRLLDSFSQQGITDVKLKIGDKGSEISGGNSKAQFRSYPTMDFAGHRAVPAKGKKLMVVPEFWKAVNRLTFSVCQDETKPQLRGLYWAPKHGLLASDNYRISHLTFTKADPINLPGILLPDRILSHCGTKLGGITEISVANNLLWLYSTDFVVYGTLLAGEFPEAGIRKIFQNTFTILKSQKMTRVTVQMEESQLGAARYRLQLFAGELTTPVQVTVQPKGILLQTQLGEGMEGIEEFFSATVTGPEGKFWVNLRSFLDAMQEARTFNVVLADITVPLYFFDVRPGTKFQHLVVRYMKAGE